MLIVCLIAFVLAAIPAGMFLLNSVFYRLPPMPDENESGTSVSVLIPARNEEASIARAVESALASQRVKVEVIVLDDHSDDRTAEIVRKLARSDNRVRLISGDPLPAGWCGKQFACHQLGKAAKNELLLFIDADVKLAPDGIARSIAFLNAAGADLVSGIPRQQTKTFGEKILVNLLHYIVLVFLPIPFMRLSGRPSLGAGCGQLFLVRRSAWIKAGGHAAIRETLHDGVRLPQEFRRHGFKTDLFDASTVASCRMYESLGGAVAGLSKNAIEGMAAPSRIALFTLLMLGGQVLPLGCLLLLLAGQTTVSTWTISLAAGGVFLSYLPRIMNAIRFRQSWFGVLLHPVGVSLFVAIQWAALFRWFAGKSPSWKGRRVAC